MLSGCQPLTDYRLNLIYYYLGLKPIVIHHYYIIITV